MHAKAAWTPINTSREIIPWRAVPAIVCAILLTGHSWISTVQYIIACRIEDVEMIQGGLSRYACLLLYTCSYLPEGTNGRLWYIARTRGDGCRMDISPTLTRSCHKCAVIHAL